MSMEWNTEHEFDPTTCRHLSNGQTTVLHCHHYASLYCQLADDAGMFDGKAMLRRSAELTFLPLLQEYFASHKIDAVDDRVALVEDYWKKSGMGLLAFDRVGELSATCRMEHSHVDRGWIFKWGNREDAVNFIGQGFLVAAMAAIFDKPEGGYQVNETTSIVSGASESRFTIVRH